MMFVSGTDTLAYLEVQPLLLVISKQSTSKTSLAQEIGKLGFSSRRNMRPKYLPSLFAIIQSVLEDLLVVRDVLMEERRGKLASLPGQDY